MQTRPFIAATFCLLLLGAVFVRHDIGFAQPASAPAPGPASGSAAADGGAAATRPAAEASARASSQPAERKTFYSEAFSSALKDFGEAVRIIAVIAGAIWAYFKFVKGRLYFSRLEPSVEGKAVRIQGSLYVTVTVKLRNVGNSVVMIDQNGTALRLFSANRGRTTAAVTVDWNRVGTFPVFVDHGWIEPGETISDNQVVTLPDTRVAALRLQLRVSNGETAWHGAAIVDLSPSAPSGSGGSGWTGHARPDRVRRLRA